MSETVPKYLRRCQLRLAYDRILCILRQVRKMGALLVADPIVTWRRCATYLRRRDLVGAVPPSALSHLMRRSRLLRHLCRRGHRFLLFLALVIRHLLHPIRLLLLHSSFNL